MMGVRHLIGINRLTHEQLFGQIIPACIEMIPRAKKARPGRRQPHKKAVFYFDEDSTRTRGSFVEAAELLGWRYIVETLACSSRNKKESWADTLHTWVNYNANVVCARTNQEGVPLWLAEVASRDGLPVAIINAGDGRNQHPTQTILDLVTIQQRLGRLDNFKIGFVGDLLKSRTAHSLLDALSMRKGISVVCVSPENVKLPRHYAGLFDNFQEGTDMELLADCHAINVVRWQAERIPKDSAEFREFLRVKDVYQINRPRLDRLKPGVIVIHALPIDEGVEEITDDIKDDPRVVIREQAWHGLPSRMTELEMSFANRQTFEPLSPVSDAQVREILNLSLQEGLERQRGKSHDHFVPLADGTVVDKLPADSGYIIKMMLRRTEGFSHGINVVESEEHNKDILVIKGRRLSEEAMIRVASLAPDATFNVMGNRFQKFRVEQTIRVITGVGICLNMACITRSGEPGIQSRFINTGSKEQPFACDYCNQHFTLSEILPPVA